MSFVPPRDPVIIRWTAHALVRAESLGIARSLVEDAVTAEHARRRKNPGAADWVLDVGRYTIA